MSLSNLIILGVVIGSNNFAVALSLGAMGQAKYRYRIMLIFGLFEFVVPLTGIWLGSAVASAMGFHSNQKFARRITSWSGLLILAATISLDNLLVGISLGFGEVNPIAVAGTIAIFAVFFTWLGLEVGNETRRRWEQVVEIAAGILLILLGGAIYAGLL